MVFLAFLALVGCDDFDPTGTYMGHANIVTTVRTMTSDLQPDGTFTADTVRGSATYDDAEVRVRRLSEHRLELTIFSADCTLPLQQSAEPNEHNAVVSQEAEQICRLSAGDWEGPMAIQGRADFDRNAPAIDVALQGSFRDEQNEDRTGHVTTTWSYTYQGTRP